MTQEDDHSSLSRVSLDSTKASLPELVFKYTNATITDIAVDWSNEDIYFINLMSSSIEVLDIHTNVTRNIACLLENPRKLKYSESMRCVKLS